MAHSFPIARRLWRIVRNWRDRHRHPFNFVIHLFGIPMTLLGIALLFATDWYWGVGLFVLGYLFQWAGHLVEGNDVGELIPLKRALGLPVVAVVPRDESNASPVSAASPSPRGE
jgi:hypothetical protein